MAHREPLNLSVRPEVKRWFKDNGILPSRFVEFAVSSYSLDPQNAEVDMRVSRLLELDTERSAIVARLKTLTGKTPEELLSRSPARLASARETGLNRLYEEIPERLRGAIDGRSPAQERQLTSWLEARRHDYGVVDSPRTIIEELRRIKHENEGA